jgi:MoxR-like ATPase
MAELMPLFSASQTEYLRELVAQTYVGEPVVGYIIDLIDATRHNDDILRGASPRATLALTAMAKAIAQLRGRDYVIPGDVREVFIHTVAHRLILTPKAEGAGKSAEQLLKGILDTVPAPRLR